MKVNRRLAAIAQLAGVILLAGAAAGCAPAEPADVPVTYDQLETRLHALSGRYEEAGDTDVGDRVLIATYCSLTAGSPIPSDFGMFSPQGDEAVADAVGAFTAEAREAYGDLSAEDRVEMVWGERWGTDMLVDDGDCL